MRRVFPSVVLVVTLATATAARADDHWAATRSFDTTVSSGTATSIAVREDNGDIRLHAADTTQVTVHAVIHAHAQADLNRIIVSAGFSGNRINVGSTCPQTIRFLGYTDACEIDYDITYPRALDVDIADTNGDVNVDGAEGNVNAHLTNGDLTINGALRSLDLSSRHGDVEAKLTAGWRGQSITLASSMGDVTLTVPHEFHGYLKAKTRLGSIDNEADLPSSPVTGAVAIYASTLFGDVVVKKSETSNH
jgi:DUF4097 and DUF4098 domain-containing protein YvlB